MATSEIMRVDRLFVKAVADRKKKLERRYRDEYGHNRRFTTKEVTRIFGGIYYSEVFGDVPIEWALKAINEKVKRHG